MKQLNEAQIQAGAEMARQSLMEMAGTFSKYIVEYMTDENLRRLAIDMGTVMLNVPEPQKGKKK